MKNRYGFIFCFILMLIFPICIYGQEGRGGGRVVGYIINEEGKPLSNVKVLMQSTSYKFKLETSSNQKGKWVFMGFTKDVFKFTFLKPGYITVSSQVALSGVNRNPDQQIVMKKYSPEQSSQLKIKSEHKAKIAKAHQFYKEEKYSDALLLFKEFVELYPSETKVSFNIANTYLKLREYKAAISEFEKILVDLQKKGNDTKAKEKSAEIYTLIAEVYMDQKEYEEAAVSYKKAMEITPPTDPAVPFNVGEIMFNTNKVDEAIKYYQLAAQLKPAKGIYYLKLGYAYLNKGNIPVTVKHFEKFLELSPNDPKVESIKKMIKLLKQQ